MTITPQDLFGPSSTLVCSQILFSQCSLCTKEALYSKTWISHCSIFSMIRGPYLVLSALLFCPDFFYPELTFLASIVFCASECLLSLVFSCKSCKFHGLPVFLVYSFGVHWFPLCVAFPSCCHQLLSSAWIVFPLF